MTVPRGRFTLKSGEESLTEYTFDSGVAKHLFCKHCGIKSFYIPRSHPDGVSVNASCLDPGTVEDMNVKQFDGKILGAILPKRSSRRLFELVSN
jgi:hypothetical protein